MPGGQNRKSTKQLKDEGTFRKDRHGDKIELSLLKGVPLPPEDFDLEHRKEWERVCRLLIYNAEIMTQVDVDSVRKYCELSIFTRKLFANLVEKGTTYEVTEGAGKGTIRANPAFEQYSKACGLMFRLFERFAFDPRSRQALKMIEPKSKEADDPLLNLNDN